MQERRLALGMDLSTQSLSAVVLDIDSQTKVYEHSLDYLKDPRLDGFGMIDYCRDSTLWSSTHRAT